MTNIYRKIRKEAKKKIGKNKLSSKKIKAEKIGQGSPEGEKIPKNKFENLEKQKFKLPSKDYALAKGEEVLLRCKLENNYGDAFTNNPKPFIGNLGNIFELDLKNETNRAIFFSALNAAFKHQNLVNKTVHCTGDDPKKCGKELAKHIQEKKGQPTIAHIGYQPGHLKACSEKFESFVTDLNPKNIGKKKFGTKIQPGTKNEKIIKKAEIALITGSSFVNGTMPQLLQLCKKHDTKPIVYGVSGKSATKLLGIEDFCPYGREKPE